MRNLRNLKGAKAYAKIRQRCPGGINVQNRRGKNSLLQAKVYLGKFVKCRMPWKRKDPLVELHCSAPKSKRTMFCNSYRGSLIRAINTSANSSGRFLTHGRNMWQSRVISKARRKTTSRVELFARKQARQGKPRERARVKERENTR